MANGLKQYETDVTQELSDIMRRMNHLHASMGGRSNRPERVALQKCMILLSYEIDRSNKEWATKTS